MILSSFIACISAENSDLPYLPKLQKTLLEGENLQILELGAGCGIVGITLRTYFPTARLILTDLVEASSILDTNIKNIPPNDPLPNPESLMHQVLDWSAPLPPEIKAVSWDLVIVADCTYNPDVVPDLVSTLGRIAEQSEKVEIVVAMKVRHDSEAVFFDLMAKEGFDVKEKAAIPLPVLEMEDEEIEIYVFKLREYHV